MQVYNQSSTSMKKIPVNSLDDYTSAYEENRYGKRSALASPQQLNSGTRLSRRSNDSRYLVSSKSGVQLVQNRFEMVRGKQEKDMMRWRKMLQLQQEQTAYQNKKRESIEDTLTRKSEQVLDLHKRRQ